MLRLSVLLVFLSSFCFSQTIEKTKADIKSIQQEITANQKIFESKLKELKANNPMFKPQSPFESDAEYLKRQAKAGPKIDQLKKEYLSDKWSKIDALRSRVFFTDNTDISIEIGEWKDGLYGPNYDANTNEWTMSISHNNHKQESFTWTQKMSRDDAQKLWENRDRIKIKGYLTFDPGDQIGLEKIEIKEPISGLNFEKKWYKALEISGIQKPVFSNTADQLLYWNKVTTQSGYYGNSYKSTLHSYKLSNDVKKNHEIAKLKESDWYVKDTKMGHSGQESTLIYEEGEDYYESYNEVVIRTTEKELYRKKIGDKEWDVGPASDFLAVEGNKGEIAIYNVKNPEIKEVIRTCGDYRIEDLKFSEDGKYIGTKQYSGYSNSSGNYLYVMRTEDGVCTYLAEKVVDFSFSKKNSNRIYVLTEGKKGKYNYQTGKTEYGPGSLIEMDIVSNQIIKQIKYSDRNTYSASTATWIEGYNKNWSTWGANLHISEEEDFAFFKFGKVTVVFNILEEQFSYNGAFGGSNFSKKLYDVTKDNKFFIYESSCDDENGCTYTFMRTGIKSKNTDSNLKETFTAPPKLEASVEFFEPNGNNYLDALEEGYFLVTINNTGKGPGKDIKINIEPEDTYKMNYNPEFIDEISAGETKKVKMPISAYLEIPDGTYDFTFSFSEKNSFEPDPIQLTFSSKKFNNPEFFIADVSIEEEADNENKDGIISDGEVLTLTARIANKGPGSVAKGVYAIIKEGEGVFITDNQIEFPIGELAYNEYYDLKLNFYLNKKCPEEIPIEISVTEENNLANMESERLEIFRSISKKSIIKKQVITGIDNTEELNIKGLRSDIDKGFPINEKLDYRYAIIIGNENYSGNQASTAGDVYYALNDAAIFKQYAINTLGIAEEKIRFETNASKMKMEQAIEWGKNVMSLEQGNGELFIYYAGHGLPDEKSKTSYIMPVDVSDVKNGIKLSDMYEKLGGTGAGKIVIFLDACFSGGARHDQLFASRGAIINPKNENPLGNMVIFSAASEEQSALSYDEQEHGLFTYFLLKKIKETKGKITLEELKNYITKDVALKSLIINQKDQKPEVNYSKAVKGIWEQWELFPKE